MNSQSSKLHFLERWTPSSLQKGKAVFRESGIKGVLRHYGWKFFVLFFFYYLVRDLIIYILIPYYFANKIF